MSKQSTHGSAIAVQDTFISLEALEYLGYTALDGVYTLYGDYEGELMPVESIDTGKDAPFCCFYLADREAALIIPKTFEATVAALEQDQAK